jgi:hypothetical protein
MHGWEYVYPVEATTFDYLCYLTSQYLLVRLDVSLTAMEYLRHK